MAGIKKANDFPEPKERKGGRQKGEEDRGNGGQEGKGDRKESGTGGKEREAVGKGEGTKGMKVYIQRYALMTSGGSINSNLFGRFPQDPAH